MMLQTTVVAEEIWMNFVANKDENQKDEQDDAMSKIKGTMGAGQGIVKCRICGGDHWTSQCPYKDTLAPLRESLQGPLDGEGAEAGPGAAAGPSAAAPAGAGSTVGGQ